MERAPVFRAVMRMRHDAAGSLAAGGGSGGAVSPGDWELKMALESADYHEWNGVRRSPWWGAWAIVRTGLSMILRRWVFWVLIGLGLLNFLFNFAFIYLKATIDVQNEMLGNFLDNYQVT